MMGDWLVGLVLANPGALRVVGRLLFSLGGILALLGLRADRVFRRVERVAHVQMTVDQVFPPWLAWAVPESVAGWAMVVIVMIIGASAALIARKIERAMR
jgi:hypothetical protein